MQHENVNLSFRRFEFKYHIPRSVCDRMIPEIMNYMAWDEYVKGEDHYDVHSIYFDSPNFKCYHEKIEGIMFRKKPRLRAYTREFNENSNLFLELKRKNGEVILKDRALMDFNSAKKFFEDPFSLNNLESINKNFANEFLFQYANYNMKPVVLVSYKRKPFFSKFDKRFRLTFDFDIEVSEVRDFDFSKKGVLVDENLVVMEVKFNGAMPRWFHEIIEKYSLNKDTFSKYCSAIDMIYGV